jgi:hypothetical protein
VKEVIQRALAKVEGVVKGAVKIIARLSYRERYEGIRLSRDSAVSVRYSERVNSRKSSFSLQRSDRHHEIVGQKRCYFQLDS